MFSGRSIEDETCPEGGDNTMKRTILYLVCYILVIFSYVSSISGFEVDGKLHKVLNLLPGASLQQIIYVSNTNEEIEEIEITQSDYLFEAKGRVSFSKKGTNPRSNAGWIKVEQDHLVLQPGTTAEVKYRIEVPGNMSLKGTYWSLINFDHKIVEETLTEKERQSSDKTSMSVNPVMGYAYQVITNIGRDIHVDMDIQNPVLIRADEGYLFQVDLHCTGERMINVAPWVEIFNTTGEKIAKARGQTVTILPDCSSRISFEMGSMQKGDYKLLLIVDSNTDKVFGGQYELEIK